MKKILAFTAVILAAACLLVFNVSTNASKKTASNQTNSLKNIQALQASAGEWKCDASSTSACSFSPPSGGVGQGTGALIYTD